MGRLKGGQFLLDLYECGDIASLSVGGETVFVDYFDKLKELVDFNLYTLIIKKPLVVRLDNSGYEIYIQPLFKSCDSADSTIYCFNVGNESYQLVFLLDELQTNILNVTIRRTPDLVEESE